MCGIAGIFSPRSFLTNMESLQAMCDVVSHRGPDDAGYVLINTRANALDSGCGQWVDEKFSREHPALPVWQREASHLQATRHEFNLFLGHRRLAVIDLSPLAHQPFSDLKAGQILSYNGEIYNYRELCDELKSLGHIFISKSDTEVVLRAYQAWGIDCVKRLNGMFAFALWDHAKKELFLARDRYGTKPLYYARSHDQIVFASEIKSILKSHGFKRELYLPALNEYFTFQNLFQDHTLFSDVALLPPGSFAKIDFDGRMQIFKYWDYDFSIQDHKMDPHQAQEETLFYLKQAVTRQMQATDVPVGGYLSGGLDSGSITALASGLVPRFTTFTAGFETTRVSEMETHFDERRDAELMANEFKTEHYEQVIHAGDLAWVMPKLIWHLEDLRLGMCYPNFYISRLASKFVKVCLSGAGGDELFGGYPWRYYRKAGHPDFNSYAQHYYRFWQRLVADEDKAALFQVGVREQMDASFPETTFNRVLEGCGTSRELDPQSCVARALAFEAKTFLHGLLLIGDKLSMANSLEERFPFLDNDLVDFAMRLPVILKIKNLESTARIDENETSRNQKYLMRYDDGKNVLREAMHSFLPPRITARKKQGFSAPDETWFRGENFEYVRETLLSKNSKMDRYLDPKYVQKIMNEHASGINHRLLIWSFLSFEEWCRQFGV